MNNYEDVSLLVGQIASNITHKDALIAQVFIPNAEFGNTPSPGLDNLITSRLRNFASTRRQVLHPL